MGPKDSTLYFPSCPHYIDRKEITRHHHFRFAPNGDVRSNGVWMFTCIKTMRQLPLTHPTLPRDASQEPTDEEKDLCPSLLHKFTHNFSIVCVAPSPKRGILFCGTQDSEILVYDLETFTKRVTFNAHSGSALCLTVSEDESTLFSGGSDSLVKVWDIESLTETHCIYSLSDIGDVFSIAWAGDIHTIFFGAQNASILYVHLRDIAPKTDPSYLPSMRFDRFFDSKGPGGNMNPRQVKPAKSITSKLIEVPPCKVMRYAHNGYVYAMQILNTFNSTPLLVSAGGDGMVKLWRVGQNYLEVVSQVENEHSVLSFAIKDTFLYCGLTGGRVNVWDLSTNQQLRSFSSDDLDIFSVALHHDVLFRGTSQGVTKWLLRGEVKSDWSVDGKAALSMCVFSTGSNDILAIAGSDKSVSVWDVTNVSSKNWVPRLLRKNSIVDLGNDHMLKTLATFISFPTVSKNPEMYIDESRKCANFLCETFKTFGAIAELIPVWNGNPIVHAVFSANLKGPPFEKKQRILWYGHYDVIQANDLSNWDSAPFEMRAQDGYLYGRGTTDNKGPVLAAMYAAAELYRQQQLPCDIVFLVEGEEECGSFGLQSAIKENRDLIGHIDWILLGNSYWLDDNLPCLNYGLRGLVSVSVTVTSKRPDLHSGVDGGLAREPTVDLVHLLSKLTDTDGKVLIPEFYEPVREIGEAEKKSYQDIVSKAEISYTVEDLLKKWRLPSLSVHKITVSGPQNSTIIPQTATASVSARIVPEQKTGNVKRQLKDFLESQFSTLKSDNTLTIQILQEAEPWLGDPTNAAFRILAENVTKEWGVEPIFIREGGSIASIKFLETELGAPAAQLPCGQSSDNAHLNNERLRVVNLFNTKNILQRTFSELGLRASVV